jgi:hypothetical protein
MLDNRFPSLEEMAIQAWKDRFFNFLILPFSVTFAVSDLVKRSYYKAFHLLFFYLSKGTFYDIESDME